MSRFDPIAGVKYGSCDTCGIDLETEEDAKRHRAETRGPQGQTSHTTRGTNPTRADRIQSWVDSVVEDAIDEALDELRQEQARANVSHDEITEALAWHSDFVDHWGGDDD